jgi:LysR family nitrogen assimilation transcriptional regulator
LTAVISDGLGATILPESMARQIASSCDAWQSRIIDPIIEAPLALCQSDHLPLSEPAQAIKEILLELVAGLPGSLLGHEERPQRTS